MPDRDGVAYDPASYRDPLARVFLRDGEVYRALSAQALANWEQVSAAPSFAALLAESKIVGTSRTDAAPGEPWVAALRHERIPVISFPYEWPFSMLRRAALLQLEVIRRVLDDGIALRDATPYNVQWSGVTPRFIDVTSFEPMRAGSLWTGYRQFCELYLFPLLLQARRGVDFQPLLRGWIDGIPVEQVARMLSPLDRLRPSLLGPVTLQAKLQQRMSASTSGRVASGVRTVSIDTRPIVASNLARMRKLVESLRWSPAGSWVDYASSNSYAAQESERKEALVARWCEALAPRVTLDVGANTGTYSRIAAKSSGLVVATDADHPVIERLFNALEEEGPRNVLPLVWDFANPTPGLGWAGRERPPLEARLEPDLVLALALIHHVAIGRNVPLAMIVERFAALGGDLVIEFVDRDDPMTVRLLAQKDEPFETYNRAEFEARLAEHYNVEATERLSPTRLLYLARRR